MKTTLVGCTGFVGGNLAAAHSFDAAYHSADIEKSFGADNGLVVYSGMPAEKFMAGADPAADLARAAGARENLRRMKPGRLVLISTVDVYPRPIGVAEDARPDSDTPGFAAYGKNRLALENWVREDWPDALIVRLPGLFGKGLKKNFIYDMLTLTPGALTEARYQELAAAEPLVQGAYAPGAGGFYRLQPLSAVQAAELRAFFARSSFNALHFTDSRSVFQFYDLTDLWKDIQRALAMGLRLLNLATEPLEAGALYRLLFGEEFLNHLDAPPAFYDMRTRYGRDFGGTDHYVADRASVVAGIARFAGRWGAGV